MCCAFKKQPLYMSSEQQCFDLLRLWFGCQVQYSFKLLHPLIAAFLQSLHYIVTYSRNNLCYACMKKLATIKLFFPNTGIFLKDMGSSRHNTEPETAEFDALSHILLLFSLVLSNNRIYPVFL